MLDEVLVVRPKAVGRRIHLIRKYGLGMSGREFAREILGVEDSSITTKIEKGQVTAARMQKVASRSPGRAAMRDVTQADVEAFLEGRTHELPLVLAADMQVVMDGDSKPPRSAVSEESAGNGYFLHVRSDLRRRNARPSGRRRNAHFPAQRFLRDLARSA